MQDFIRRSCGKFGKVCLDALGGLSRGGMVPLAQVFGLLLELLEAGTGGGSVLIIGQLLSLTRPVSALLSGRKKLLCVAAK